MFRKISSISWEIWGGALIRAGALITVNTVYNIQDFFFFQILKSEPAGRECERCGGLYCGEVHDYIVYSCNKKNHEKDGSDDMCMGCMKEYVALTDQCEQLINQELECKCQQLMNDN